MKLERLPEMGRLVAEAGEENIREEKFIAASMHPYQFYLTVSLEETLRCSNASDA